MDEAILIPCGIMLVIAAGFLIDYFQGKKKKKS